MKKLLDKMIVTLLTLLLLPVLANATNYWQVTRSASPSTAVTSLAAPVDSSKYATSGNTTYVISASENLATSYLEYTLGAPPSGYALVNVKVDNVVTSAIAGKYRITRGTATTHSVVASYTVARYTINTVASAGGSIDASRTVAAFPQTVNVIPAPGYHLSGLTLNGSPLSSEELALVKAAGALTLTVTGNYTVAPSFGADPVVVAKISNASQTSTTGVRVALDGTATSSNVPTTYLWTVSPVDGGTLSTPTAPTTGFTVAKTSTVTLTATGGGIVSTTSVVITVQSPSAFNSISCISCHNSDNLTLAGSATLTTAYRGSLHYTQTTTADTSCLGCHNPTGALQHHFDPAPTGVCAGCHVPQFGTPGKHDASFSGAICVNCHDPHSALAVGSGLPTSAHYNNITTGSYPASYMSSKADCTNCHFNSPANAAIRGQWAGSGHALTKDAPFATYDFKTMSGCVQCHTTTGFIAFSSAKVTAAWGVASDKTKEVITCVACHSDMTTGALRSVTPARPYADTPSYANRNVGKSNICMDCHSGRNTGKAIASLVGKANFTNQSTIPPHYLAAAGTLHGQAGYNFPGQVYAFYSSNTHRGIGMGDKFSTGTAGPCITCHKDSVSGHTFQAGATALCNNCHMGSMTPALLAGQAAGFANGLSVLKIMLADQGFVYTPSYPYFANKNWGVDQAGANVMGAAFNFVLLTKEPGAYAHNPAYAKKLIADSIDAVYNGGPVTGSIDSALAYLVQKGSITQAIADALKSSQAATNCATCHAAPSINYASGSHGAHLAEAVSCAACHATTASSNTSIVAGTVTHLNGAINVALAGGGSYSGGLTGSCNGVACHSDGMGNFGTVVWGSGKLTCKSCHPVLVGSHAAHIGNLLDSATFYNYTGNYSTGASYRFGCSNCHPTDVANHRNGKIDLALAPDPAAGSLKNLNDTSTTNTGIGNTGSGITGTAKVSVVCSATYCHSNGYTNGTLVYASSPDWYNPASYTGDRCVMCHGNSPNSSIAGSAAHTVHTVGIHSLNVYSGGFGNLTTGSIGNVGHGIASQSTTINCDTCHNDTVTSSRNDANNACIGCHNNQGNALTIANKGMHVNGRVDVTFANISVVSKAQLRPASFAAYSASVWTRNGGNYKNGAAAFDTSKTTLRHAATYDAGNCSNVACHMGRPVDWSNTNSPSYCALCHTAL